MNCYSKTDIGYIRAENQDRVCILDLGEGAFAAIVCDGMGGENAGSEASSNAIRVLSDIISRGYRSGADENSIRNLLISAVNTANAVIYDLASSNEEMSGMGTTCVAAIFCENNAHIINVGDSRAYFIADNEITQITVDHTVVMDMYINGEISKKELKTHPKRNYLTKALGVSNSVGPDYFEIKGIENSIFLLCTDGLTGVCEDSDILHKLNQITERQTSADEMVQFALDSGSRDNVSAVVIYCDNT